MTIHTYHPDSHTHGLHPDCPRCQEHAEHPHESLDAWNRARLLCGDVFTDLDRQALAVLRQRGDNDE